MMQQQLNTQPARTDLTDRECAKLLGGLIGCLCQMTTPATVRDAVNWWAQADQAWAVLKASSAGINPTDIKGSQ